jgi:quinol monooxygenase YgiN
MSALVILDMQAQPDQIDRLREVLGSVLAETRAFNACKRIDMFQNGDDPTNFMVIEEWTTMEEYEKYVKWRMETGTGGEFVQFLVDPPSSRHFSLVAPQAS